MELRFQLTAEEYVYAVLQYWRRARRFNRLLLQLILALFLVAFDTLVLAIPTIRDKGPAWFGLATGVFLLVDLYVLAPWRLRRLFRRSPNVNNEHRMTIGDDGIKTVLPNAVEDVRWTALQKVYETERLFLVMYSPVQFYIIPKRALATAELNVFRALVRTRGLAASD